MSRKKTVVNNAATQNKTEQSGAYGKITSIIDVHGPVDGLDQLRDQLQFNAMIALNAELVQSGLANGQYQASSSRRQQSYQQPLTFGNGSGDDITVDARITFDLRYDVPATTLNRMILDTVVPTITRTVGQHLGDGQTLSTPPNHATALWQEEKQAQIDSLTGLATHPTRMPGEVFRPDYSDDQQGRRQDRTAITR